MVFVLFMKMGVLEGESGNGRGEGVVEEGI